MVGNDTDAEDLTHDVLLHAIEKLPSFRGESSLGTWLHRSAVNAALGYRRRQAVQRGHRSREPLDTVLEGEQSSETPVRPWSVAPEQAAVDRETQQLLEGAIRGLAEPYRDVFLLADVEGLPNAEIAEMLGVSVAAVKSRLHRARMMLREVLAPHFEEVRA
jgi:RNA polymerase sigma-70 factor (ECF subfamily)